MILFSIWNKKKMAKKSWAHWNGFLWVSKVVWCQSVNNLLKMYEKIKIKILIKVI